MSSGAREQLKQRCRAENVEVARVKVIFREKTRSRFAEILPSVFESCEAVFVEGDSAGGAVERANHTVVPDRERNERRNRNREEPGGCAGPKHQPRGQCEARNDGQASVADAGIEAGEARMFSCARRPPFAIFS